MPEKSPLQSAFSSWKIALAVLLGLGIASWMVISSLRQVHFVETGPGQGTHSWQDANHNQKIDLNDAKEFNPDPNGTYRQQQLADLLTEINWTTQSVIWIFMAMLCMVGRDFFYMVRIRILTKKKLTWKSSFSVIMLWEFASALSPGVLSGSAVAMFILNREKIPLGRSTAIIVITTMMDNLFYVLMVPFVFFFIAPEMLFPAHTAAQQSVEFIFWAGFSVFALLCALLFISIFWYPQLIGRFLSFIFRLPFLKKWRPKALETGNDIVLTSHELKKEPFSFWIGSFGATVLSWMSRYLVINCILQAFLHIRFSEHLFILGKQLVLWLFMRISPTPGGSGIAEYAFGELMSDLSSSALLLAGLALLWRLISYFPYLFIGALILPRWLRSRSAE